MKAIGKTHAVLGEYLAGALGTALDSQAPLAVRLETLASEALVAVASCGACSLVIALGSVPAHARAELAIYDVLGRRLWTGATWLAEGDQPLRCSFASLPLNAGSYKLRVALEVAGQRVVDRPAGDLDVILQDDHTPGGDGPLALSASWSRG